MVYECWTDGESWFLMVISLIVLNASWSEDGNHKWSGWICLGMLQMLPTGLLTGLTNWLTDWPMSMSSSNTSVAGADLNNDQIRKFFNWTSTRRAQTFWWTASKVNLWQTRTREPVMSSSTLKKGLKLFEITYILMTYYYMITNVSTAPVYLQL